MRRLLVLAFALSIAPHLFSQSLAVSPASWEMGFVRRGDTPTATIVVSNTGGAPLSVSLISTCGCLTVAPTALTLAPHSRASVELSFDTSSYSGEVTKSLIIAAPGTKPVQFIVHGTVKGAERLEGRAAGNEAVESGAPPEAAAAGGGLPRVDLTYYYAPGCKSCERFLSQEIPRLQSLLGLDLSVRARDVLDSEVYGELAALAAARGASLTAIPVLDVEGRLLQGDEEIASSLEPLLAAAVSGSARTAPPQAPGAGVTPPPPALESLSAIPVLAGGLLDGINPCAFTTLIFLLASLALAGRGRREVLVIGALFTAAVFFTYLGIGVGLFAALRAAAQISLVSLILRWVLVAVLVVFAALSMYDFALIKSGRPTRIVLQLPSALKRRIHASIRTRVRTAALAGSSLALGFLVSIFEFACTGQVYLPTLAYLVRMTRAPSALLLLVVYNLGFIAPLLAVFGASYAGVGSARITTLFQKHMAAVKAGLAVFFLGLAAFTLLT